MSNILLQLLIIVHILIWIFILFGGFISSEYTKFIIYKLIPFIYVIHILPFHTFVETKLLIIDKNKDDSNKDKSSKSILDEEEDKYIIPLFFRKLNNIFSSSFANPLSPQGLLLLGYIINTYLLRNKWKECM
jgi:hypothetical protein